MPGAKTIRGGFDSHTFPPIRRPAVVLALLLCAFLFHAAFPAAVWAQERRDAPKVSPFWSSVRSLAFPGWGQLHNGSRVKAVVLFSFQSYLWGRVFITERRSGFYRSLGDSEDPPWDPVVLHQRADDLRDRRGDLVWWGAILTLYSVIDAYVDAQMAGFDEDVEEVNRITFAAEPREGGCALAIRSTF